MQCILGLKFSFPVDRCFVASRVWIGHRSCSVYVAIDIMHGRMRHVADISSIYHRLNGKCCGVHKQKGKSKVINDETSDLFM